MTELSSYGFSWHDAWGDLQNVRSQNSARLLCCSVAAGQAVLEPLLHIPSQQKQPLTCVLSAASADAAR